MERAYISHVYADVFSVGKNYSLGQSEVDIPYFLSFFLVLTPRYCRQGNN